jgi:hypothetical protein
MARLVTLALTVSTLALAALAAQAQKPTHDYPVQPIPFTAVHLDDEFWAPRIETNRKVTIPAAFQQCDAEQDRIYVL